jgi:membrane-associated phospholipid phosphatase
VEKGESRFKQAPLKATDAVILATLALFTVLTLVFCQRITGWGLLVLKNLAVGVAYVAFQQIAARARSRPIRFALRLVPVTLTYGYLFLAVDKLQLIVHGRFLDDIVMRFESAIFGVQPTLWLEQFTRPAVTEWMMFAYMFYFLMYPILCAIIYFRDGEAGMEDYFFTLGLTNILCDLGFILFPVAGPIAAMGDRYTVPLKGYLFTWLGEWVRVNMQFPGGSIPSPHCAAATVMWAMAYRYHRPVFWLLLPVVLSLYVSTFYGRYHYVSDAVLGIATALVAAKLAPALARTWERRKARTAEGKTLPALPVDRAAAK